MRITILIPAYNAASTLVETLESLASQSPESLALVERIVIADDGSTDNTVQVARAFMQGTTLPFEVRLADKNRGERATVNNAFRQMREAGIDWCMVLHADDVARPDWLSTLVSMAASADASADAKVVSVCTSWNDWYPDRLIPGQNDLATEKVVIEGGTETAKGTLRKGCWWHFSGCAMNLQRFWEVGPFREDMPQLGDLDWLIRSELAGTAVWYVPRSLINYRQSESNVSAVSFRTNRDLREMLLICKSFVNDVAMRDEIRLFGKRQSKVAARRCVTSLLRGQWNRALSAGVLSMKLLLQSYKKPSV